MLPLWSILVDFIFRLTFGMAIAMGLTPSRWVTSGFFRVHLWVLMGLETFAALALYSSRGSYDEILPGRATLLIAAAIVTAAVSYVGAVIWLYERAKAGKIALGLAAASSAAGCLLLDPRAEWGFTLQSLLRNGDWLPGGLVLGSVITAMLLGHWYLNNPGMRMAPLERLLLFIVFALVLRAIWSGGGLLAEIAARGTAEETLRTQFWLFLSLRWLAGIVAPAAFTWLTWLTLKIPNTQSATGILYAAVILVFIGELTSRLMSVATSFPV